MAKEIQKQTNSGSLTLQQHYAQQFKQASEFTSIMKATEHALSGTDVRIAEILRTGNSNIVKVHIAEAIASYVELVHPNRGITPEQIMNMSDAFLSHPDLRHLSVSELKTFFAMAFKTQRLGSGKLYAGFGYDVLLEWFADYYRQRMDAVITFRERQHSEYKVRERTRDDSAFKDFNHNYNLNKYRNETEDKRGD